MVRFLVVRRDSSVFRRAGWLGRRLIHDEGLVVGCTREGGSPSCGDGSEEEVGMRVEIAIEVSASLGLETPRRTLGSSARLELPR